jgi:hypothetical protein
MSERGRIDGVIWVVVDRVGEVVVLSGIFDVDIA